MSASDRWLNKFSGARIPVGSTGRRKVLQLVGALIVGCLFGFRAAFAQPKKLALSLDKAEKLKSPGTSVLLKILDRELLFVRDSEDSVHILDPTCTHKKCTVEYDRDKQQIVCPCHGSTYSLDGRLLKGPAEKPLQAFEAVLDAPKNRIIFSTE